MTDAYEEEIGKIVDMDESCCKRSLWKKHLTLKEMQEKNVKYSYK